MLNENDVGLIAQFLVFIPLSRDKAGFHAMGWRFLTRGLLQGWLALATYSILRKHRGSPTAVWSKWLGVFRNSVLFAVLHTADYVELQGLDLSLQEFNDALLVHVEILLLLAYCVHQVLLRTIPIPGPVFARYTSLWKVYHLYRGTYNREIVDLHRRLGEIVRVGPYEYSFGTVARLSEEANNLAAFHSGYRSPSIVELLLIDQDSVAPYMAVVAKMDSQVHDYEDTIDECNKVLLDSLLDYASRGEQLHLSRVISCYAWDVMGATTTGRRFGFMDMDTEIVAIIDRMADWKFFAVLYGTFFRFHPWILWIFEKLTMRHRIESKLAETLQHIVEEKLSAVVDCDESSSTLSEPRSSEAVPPATSRAIPKSGFISSIQEIIDKDPDNEANLLTIVGALLLVGSDPLAVHIMTVMFYLSCTANAVEKLRSELNSLDPPLSSVPTITELIERKERLPYLHSILAESHRLRPSQVFNFTKLAQPGQAGQSVKECRIPPYSTVQLADVSMIRTDYAAEDVDGFAPERFMDREGPSFAVFGPLYPPNPDVAQALAAKIIVQIVQKFDITLDNPPASGVIRMSQAAAQFSIARNLDALLTTAGIKPGSPVADYINPIRLHLGIHCLRMLLEARACDEPEAQTKYATLVGVKTGHMPDNKTRRLVHEAIHILSKGALESNTLADNYIEIVPRGCSKYRPRDRENRYNASQRGHGRWGTQGRAGHGGRGGRVARGGRSRDDNYKNNFLELPTTPRSSTQSINTASAGLSNWNSFKDVVVEKDRVANEAAKQHIDALAAEQKASGLTSTQTWKQTAVINGKRTVTNVVRHDGPVEGSVLIRQAEEPKKPCAPREVPSGYIPPHKRGRTVVTPSASNPKSPGPATHLNEKPNKANDDAFDLVTKSKVIIASPKEEQGATFAGKGEGDAPVSISGPNDKRKSRVSFTPELVKRASTADQTFHPSTMTKPSADEESDGINSRRENGGVSLPRSKSSFQLGKKVDLPGAQPNGESTG